MSSRAAPLLSFGTEYLEPVAPRRAALAEVAATAEGAGMPGLWVGGALHWGVDGDSLRADDWRDGGAGSSSHLGSGPPFWKCCHRVSVPGARSERGR